MPSLSPNQLDSALNVDDQQNEILSEKQSLTRLQNEIGSKVLSLVNFESKHKDIVESSFNKARQNKEKLPGKNNERRNFAYLSRLDRMIEKHGDALEKNSGQPLLKMLSWTMKTFQKPTGNNKNKS